MKPKTILVVDDDIDVVEQLTVVLEAAGYAVRAAYSRAEAEQALLDGAPDLAVVDLMMETMDAGFVLCHHLKSLHPCTPVVLLTAVTSETGFAFEAGGGEGAWVKADRILDKPVRTEQLLHEVATLLPE